MKISKPLKIAIISLSVTLAMCAVVIPTTLYFTIWNKNNSESDNRVDLGKQQLNYQTKVADMTQLTSTEATTITNDIKNEVKQMLTALNLETTTDYQILNLEKITADSNLKDIINLIEIKATDTSEKARGSFKVQFTIEENISTRMLEISLDAEDQEGLTASTIMRLNLYIPIEVRALLNKGQTNLPNTDYEIIGLALLIEGAKLEEFQGKVKVVGKSAHLIGEFSITFKFDD